MSLAEGEYAHVRAFTLHDNVFSLFEVILGIRTWAVWNRNKLIGVGLAILIIAVFVLQCIYINQFVHSMECKRPDGCIRYDYLILVHAALIDASSPYPGFRGCFITNADRILGRAYISLTVVEASQYFAFSFSYWELTHPCSLSFTPGH